MVGRRIGPQGNGEKRKEAARSAVKEKLHYDPVRTGFWWLEGYPGCHVAP